MGHTWVFPQYAPQGQVDLSLATADKMKVLKWPSQSTDLSVIEPLWGELKHAVHASQRRNLQELEASYQEEWAA